MSSFAPRSAIRSPAPRRRGLFLALSLGLNATLLVALFFRPTVGPQTSAPIPKQEIARSPARSVATSVPAAAFAPAGAGPATITPAPETILSSDDEIGKDGQRPRLEDFPREKTRQLQSIAADYRELAEQIYARSSGIIPPEDREKLGLLEQEKNADLAKVLTPPELEEYQQRSSDTDRLQRR